MLVRMWRKEDHFALLVRMQIGAATVESSIDTSTKLKINLPFDPAIPLLGIHSKEPKTNSKKYYTPIFFAVLCTITKIWKQPKCPSVDQWIKQLWDIYTIEFYLAIIKKKIYPL